MKNQKARLAVREGMQWLASNWRWAALNLSAFSALVYVLTQGSTAWDAAIFDPGLEAGKWAIRWLLVSLTMSPLNLYLGWHGAIKLRKPAGLWALAFAIVHLIFDPNEPKWTWLAFPVQPFIMLGLLGIIILTALAVTSNRWAMQRLQKNWKRLHRLVYVGSMAIVLHAILATTASKKLAIRDPQSIHELQIYLAVLVVSLAVRLPIIQQILMRAFTPRRIARRADLPITPVIVPSMPSKLLPEIYAIEGDVAGVEFKARRHESAQAKPEMLPERVSLPLAR